MKIKPSKSRKSSPKPYTPKRLHEHQRVHVKVLELLKALNSSTLKDYHTILYYEMKDAVVSWMVKFETSSRNSKHLTQPISTTQAQADEFIEKHKDCKKNN